MDPVTIEYWFGTGTGQPSRWHGVAEVDVSGDGIADAIGLDFDGDGRRDDLLWDSDGDGRADRSLLDLDDDGRAESAFADPDGRGIWGQQTDDSPARPRRPGVATEKSPAEKATSENGTRRSMMFSAIGSDAEQSVAARAGAHGMVARADIDGDGHADDTLIDRDRDGRADLAVVTDPGGRPERLYVDTTKDGRWDLVLVDTNNDGRADRSYSRGQPGFQP